VLLVVIEAVIGCGRGDGAAVDAGGGDLERARAILESPMLPPRPDVAALAHTLQASAEKEGAGPRAVTLHATAGQLYERSWRALRVAEDAKQADVAYEAAGRDPRAEGACGAAVRRALLAGDVAADAETTNKELYRVSRKFAASSGVDAGVSEAGAALVPGLAACLQDVSTTLAGLGAFRPPQKVLDAVDQSLATEGSLGALPTLGNAGPPRVVRVEQWPGKEAARVVIVLDKQATFRTGDEASAGGRTPRVFVELDGVDRGTTRDALGSGMVTHVGVEGTTTGTRVTLDLDGPAYRRTFFLLEPYRVVIDIARHPPNASTHKRQVAKLVLDPGHGGTDAGAVGPAGTKEKDITLDVAHKVAPVLAKEGLSVVLTRDDDRFVSLEERTARANQVAADLFVSIHCNAAENHSRHGVETYVLDTTKDEIASRVAARENATSQAATAELGSILASMRLADQASRSTHLAELLQKAAMASLHAKYPDALDGGVHPAGFYVLVGARMPAVLFETSYVSNPTEETRLASEDYKDRLADALVNAIRAYRDGR
jgi:N-acetylmuramoyl-L-alanine amidase